MGMIFDQTRTPIERSPLAYASRASQSQASAASPDMALAISRNIAISACEGCRPAAYMS